MRWQSRYAPMRGACSGRCCSAVPPAPAPLPGCPPTAHTSIVTAANVTTASARQRRRCRRCLLAVRGYSTTGCGCGCRCRRGRASSEGCTNGVGSSAGPQPWPPGTGAACRCGHSHGVFCSRCRVLRRPCTGRRRLGHTNAMRVRVQVRVVREARRESGADPPRCREGRLLVSRHRQSPSPGQRCGRDHVTLDAPTYHTCCRDYVFVGTL